MNLSGALHQPKAVGRGPPLTARTTTIERVCRAGEREKHVPGIVRRELDTMQGRLEVLNDGPAPGSPARTLARRIRSWFRLICTCNFPLMEHTMEEWTAKMHEAIRPIPPPIDTSKWPNDMELPPPPTPDRSLGADMDEDTWMMVAGRRISTKKAVYPGSPLFETIPWIQKDTLQKIFDGMAGAENTFGVDMPPTINYSTFGCILCVLLCGDRDRFTECFKHMDIDEEGKISWPQLETMAILACHGDALFTADLLKFFATKLHIQNDPEQGTAIRPLKYNMKYNRRDSDCESDDGMAEVMVMDGGDDLVEVSISLAELTDVVNNMDPWLSSTGWEWPTWTRPMTAGPWSHHCMGCGAITSIYHLD